MSVSPVQDLSVGRSLIAILVSLGCVAVDDLAAQERTPAQDFDTLIAAGNTTPQGIWSDGTTMWVADLLDGKLYAYTVATRARDPRSDFDTLSAAGNIYPTGIWSDGATMWVADFLDEKLYAYTVATKAHDPRKDFDTLVTAGNTWPAGVWSNGTTMWVADFLDEKLYAYTVATKARDPRGDFDTLSAAGNIYPTGIWSDGTTMWVAENGDRSFKLYAYAVATRTRDPRGDFDTLSAAGNTGPQGIWSDGTTIWVADDTGWQAGDTGSRAKLYAYALPVKDAGPTFGSAAVPPLTYTWGVRISPRVLPAATGGRGPLTYTLTPALPAGLTFTAATRTLAGTPAAVQAATTYALTATDASGDSATLTFRLTVESGGGPGTRVFTDPTLTPGETPIKAVHFAELREAVNALRSRCGLASAAWTDPVLTPGVTPVRTVHLAELRTGLTAAYRACGLTPVPTFTDVVRAGTPIRALHITELRAAVNGVPGNRAPQPSGAIPGQTLTAGGDVRSVNVARYFSDPDGDALTYSARSNRTSVVRPSVARSTVTLAPVRAGTAMVTVTARDPGGLSAVQTIAVTVRDAGGGWQRTGSGPTILDLPTSITRIRIEGAYNGYLENFVVWCGIEGDQGGLLVNEVLGTAPGYSTRYSGVHSALRDYNRRGEPCRQLQIKYSEGVRWTITEVSSRSGLSPSAGTGSLAGDQAAVKRAIDLRRGR